MPAIFFYKTRRANQYRSRRQMYPARAYGSYPRVRKPERRFFASHGFSITGENLDSLAERAYHLCQDEAALSRMRSAQEQGINRFAADTICDFIANKEVLSC